MRITGYSVERLNDPTGILLGERYEFFLDIEVDEDDELFEESGLKLRVLLYRNDEESSILNYHFLASEKILDLALEEEEERIINKFCQEHYEEAN